MNAVIHSQISVKHYRGVESDYYALHDFLDCSKEVESTNKHRIFMHCLWGVKNIVIPIFGHTIVNSDGKKVNVKDLCESDHILPDYRGRFIPTLIDFVDCVEDSNGDKALIEAFQKDNAKFLASNPKIKELMMSPFYITGKIKSLLLTHNSWFIGFILPKIFKNIKIELKNYNINPSVFFNRMEFKPWMQNGNGLPPSYQKLDTDKKGKKNGIEELTKAFEPLFKPVPVITKPTGFELFEPLTDDVAFDGTPKSPVWIKPKLKPSTYD